MEKTELPWLNEISNNVPKQAVKDLCLAYKRFFKGQAKQPELGCDEWGISLFITF